MFESKSIMVDIGISSVLLAFSEFEMSAPDALSVIIDAAATALEGVAAVDHREELRQSVEVLLATRQAQ